MTGTKKHRFCHFCIWTSFVWTLSCQNPHVYSLPYFLLTSHAAKCMHLDVARGSTIWIQYDCPDLVPLDTQGQDQKERKEEETEIGKDGLDSRYTQRLEELKKMSRNLRDISIMVTQRLESKNPLAWRRSSDSNNQSGTWRLREQPEARTGSMEFLTGENDGRVEVCIQSLAARTIGASRVALNITVERTETEDDRSQKEAERKRLQEEQAKDQAAAVQGSSRITGELQSLEERIKQIESTAEYAKDREVEFHQTTVRLNRAVRYWPMFRVAVLVVAGYFQVTHIITYMKSKHIIY